MNNKRNLLENPWAVRLLSLFLSILLVAFVAVDINQGPPTRKNQNTASVNVVENISNVPVYLSEAPEDMFVSNLPESVSVRISGPRSIVNQVLSKDLYVLTEDLSEAEPGSKQIRLEIPAELVESEIEYQINPSRIIVNLDRREMIELPVEVDFNYEMISEGYTVSDIRLSQETVFITGKEKNIERIHRVYINIDPSRVLTDSFTRSYNVEVRDERGNLIDVIVEPLSIEATIDIQEIPPGTTVEAILIPFNEHSDRYKYNYIWTEAETVTLSGNDDVLSSIKNVEAHLDVADITTSGTYLATIQWPNGINRITPTVLPVYVEVIPLEETNESSIESQTEVLESEETSEQ